MSAQKISISLPPQLYAFVENYQEEQHLKSRSEVIAKALQMLQEIQLAADYEAANTEIDDAFDVTIADGLDEDETW